MFGMNAMIARQKPIGPSAASMNGRRRPIGVLKVSLQGPITSGSVSANTPSAASTAAIIVFESVNFSSSGGRYAAVVVIEKASPNAPRPRIQTRPRRVAHTSIPSQTTSTTVRSAAATSLVAVRAAGRAPSR